MNSAIAYRNGPIAFFRFGRPSDTGRSCMARLIRELGRVAGVVTIDVCGGGSEHKANLHNTGLSSLPLFPEQPYMTTLNGMVELPNLVQGTLSIPNVGEAVSRLRRALHEVRPRAVCLDDERTLFVAWLAMPPELPLVYLATSDLHGIRSYCAPAWCRVNAALGVSEYSLRYLRSTHYAHGNLYVVGSGIDVGRLVARVGAQMDGRLPASQSLPGTLNVLSPMSFPRPLKGHRLGMQAIASLNRIGVPAELWLCGQQCRPARSSGAEIADLAAELGVQEHVRVLRRRSSIPSTVARSDVALFLSSTPESHQSVLEAMALARPVVAARTGSMPELVRDGIDGILVDPDDVGATVVALQRLSDPALRKRMGSSGQRRVREEFSVGRQVDRVLGAIEAIGCSSSADEPNWLARDWLFS
jgi:glycosyltransferase involved in cell wall biosynthesis